MAQTVLAAGAALLFAQEPIPALIVLVLFGGQKLPEFARGLGKSIREFKKAAAGVEEENVPFKCFVKNRLFCRKK